MGGQRGAADEELAGRQGGFDATEVLGTDGETFGERVGAVREVDEPFLLRRRRRGGRAGQHPNCVGGSLAGEEEEEAAWARRRWRERGDGGPGVVRCSATESWCWGWETDRMERETATVVFSHRPCQRRWI